MAMCHKLVLREKSAGILSAARVEHVQ